MNWWSAFWAWASDNALGATVVGGLILAALLWVLSRIPKLGVPMRQAFRWVLNVRVTTGSRIAAIRTEREDELAEANSARYHLSRELAVAQQKMKDLEYEKLTLTGKLAVAKTLGSATGKSRIVPAESPKPKLPPPRWSIRRNSKDDPKRYVLLNWEPTSRASNIRLDAPADMFDFYDKARWDELEDTGDYYRDNFSGHVKGKGRSEGVMFTVTWEDEDGREQSAFVHLERPPRQAIVLS